MVLLAVAAAVATVAVWMAVGRPQVQDPVDKQALDTGPDRGPAPAFELPNLADPETTVTLADYRGQPVVVNFWASWCGPCRREMPRLAAAARRLEGQVAFIGVNYFDSRDSALELADETGVPYPSGMDRDGDIGARYGLVGMPTTVFVTAAGDIAGRYLGELSEETLDGFLAQLTAAG